MHSKCTVDKLNVNTIWNMARASIFDKNEMKECQ